MKQRISSLLLVVTLFLTTLIPVSANFSMLVDTATWTQLTAAKFEAVKPTLPNQNCFFILYSSDCGYSKKWMPQYFEYANQHGCIVYALDSLTCDFDTGDVFSSIPAGKYPYIVEYSNGETYSYSSVHSLRTFETIMTGKGKQSVGDFVIQMGVLTDYRGTETDLVIPANLGITAIGSRCFDGTNTPRSVVIPEGVTALNAYALNGNTLVEVYLPSTLKIIDSYNLNSSGLQTVYFAGPKPAFGKNYALGMGKGTNSYGDEINAGRFAAVLPEGKVGWGDLTSLKSTYPHVNWGAKPGQIRSVPTSAALEGKASGWAIPYVAEAISYGLKPDSIANSGSDTAYQSAISRKHFCFMVMNLIYKQMGEKSAAIQSLPAQSPFTDISYRYNEDICRAYYLKLVSGKGNGQFDPDGSITRQEAAVMLRAAGEYLGLKATAAAKVYPDESSIASWAAASVDYVTALGIMSGTDKGFEPYGTYSYEQAYCTFLKLCSLISQ